MIVNCLFARNTPGTGGAGSTSPPGSGGAAGSGAIAISGVTGQLRLVNITCTANALGVPGSGMPTGAAAVATEIVAVGTPGQFSVRNAVLWEATSGTPLVAGPLDIGYSLCAGAVGIGNIGGAPLFVGAPNFEWRLAPHSPAIDAGDNTAVGVAGPDLAGRPRFVNDSGTPDTGVSGSAGGANVVDMGAYEFQGLCAGDFDGSGVLEVADIFAFLNAFLAGNPSADFNGGGLAQQDIFDFINAWFAGC
jgi:hypothetical protein